MAFKKRTDRASGEWGGYASTAGGWFTGSAGEVGAAP
jgi:hypothetical protein